MQTNTVHIIDPISVEISSFKVFKVFKASRLKPLKPWKTWNLELFAQDVPCKYLRFKTVVWHARQLVQWIKQFKVLRPSLTVLCKQIQCTFSTRCWSKSQVSKFSRYSRLQGFTFEILEKLETWNCLHKTFRASTWDFKRWCDMRANLYNGLNNSKFCARPWPSCANKYSAHFRPDFGRNLKFQSFQGIQGFKA